MQRWNELLEGDVAADEMSTPVGKPAMPANGKSRNAHQYRRIEQIMRMLRRHGHVDLRGEQQQVGTVPAFRDGKRTYLVTGTNVPDVQSIALDGGRRIREVDTDPDESVMHSVQNVANNPRARLIAERIDPDTGRLVGRTIWNPFTRRFRHSGRPLTPLQRVMLANVQAQARNRLRARPRVARRPRRPNGFDFFDGLDSADLFL